MLFARLQTVGSHTIAKTYRIQTSSFIRTFTCSRNMSQKKDVLGWANSKDGEFRRHVSAFRDTIEKGGKFEPEKDRYHLYVSYACPWAHRTLIVRQLKGLDKFIGLSVVDTYLGDNSWGFVGAYEGKSKTPGATEDHLFGSKFLKEIYKRADPEFDQRFTVPVLWDKKNNTIVNNESSEIIRIFNSAFNDLITPEQAKIDLYPKELQSQIEEQNKWVYDTINNGVYKCGFAGTQQAYNNHIGPLFESLDKMEAILGKSKYCVGDQLTEADVRLFTTIIRFDTVYYTHFKTNINTIRHGYPHIHKWMRELYWKNPAFKDTSLVEHFKKHYFESHAQINPTRIVPRGPIPDIEPLDQ